MKDIIIYFFQMQKHSISAFIDKTWTMLQRCEYEHVICWNEDGESFRIINEAEFEEVVLPIYFKHSNLTSFQRQLNMYNFHKRKNQYGQTEYYHRLFRRHQRDLLRAIRRKPSEDEIQIGEELLRKLVQEHEETHHQILAPQEQKNSIESKQHERVQEAPKATQEPEPSHNLSFFMPQVCPPPMMWYYFPTSYQSPFVGYTPERIINTHILIHTPKDSQGSL